MLYNLFALCCWGQTGFPFSGRIIEFPLRKTKTWFLDYFYIVAILINIVWLSGSTVDLKTFFFCLSFIKFSSIVRLLYLPSFWLSPLTFLINDNWISWIVFFLNYFLLKCSSLHSEKIFWPYFVFHWLKNLKSIQGAICFFQFSNCASHHFIEFPDLGYF